MPITRDRFVLAFGGSIQAAADRSLSRVEAALGRLGKAVRSLGAMGGTVAPFDQELATMTGRRNRIEGSGDSWQTKYEQLGAIESRALIQARAAEDAAKQRARNTDESTMVAALKAAMAAGNAAVIDRMVEDLGDKVSNADDRKFLRAALKARYDIDTVTGDMTSKALPKLYKLLGMVPEAHTTGNASLKSLTRSDSIFDVTKGSSFDATTKGVVINLPKSSIPWSRKAADGSRTWMDGFTLATLHEVGHSVDDKLKFMNGKAGLASFGGWQSETTDSIAAKATDLKGFAASYPTMKRDDLETYLKGVLETGTPPDPADIIQTAERVAASTRSKLAALDRAAADRGFAGMDAERERLVQADADDQAWADAEARFGARPPKLGSALEGADAANLSRQLVRNLFTDRKSLHQAIADRRAAIGPVPIAPTMADFNQLANHPAVAWCRGIRMSGGASGAWDSGPGGAGAAALSDGRVYQQAYANQWNSYALSSRAKGISDYQFRAAGEWFSELYAFYYMEKLSPSAPDYRWLTEEVHVAQ